MPIEIVNRFKRDDLRERADAMFVFGDNMERRGLGGQAKECRGEPNAVGIPTKWAPSMAPSAFFSDRDFWTVKPEIDAGFFILADAVKSGRTVIFPADGIGTGLARLPTCAPRIHAYIQKCTDRLRAIANEL